jgi:Mn-dependent DtxR family transcriptional regulator
VSRPQKASTRAIRGGIIAALQDGPATVREIEARMGFRASHSTQVLLEQLTREGLVHRVGSQPAIRGFGRRAYIWALVENSEAAA